MATANKISQSELSQARKAGFKRSKPKKPKASASLSSLENYITKYNNWVRAAKDKIASKKQKETDKKRKLDLRNKIKAL